MGWFGRRDEAKPDDDAPRVFEPSTATLAELEQALAFLRERLLEHAVDEGTGNVVDRKIDRRGDAERARLDQQLQRYIVQAHRALTEMKARSAAQQVLTEARMRDLNQKRAALEAAVRALVGGRKPNKRPRGRQT